MKEIQIISVDLREHNWRAEEYEVELRVMNTATRKEAKEMLFKFIADIQKGSVKIED